MWYHDGNICHTEAITIHVRLTFLKGTFLEDPNDLFNAGFEVNALRAIVIHEEDDLGEKGFKPLKVRRILQAASEKGVALR